MAKNVESTTYRKLDVDALAEDKFDEGDDGYLQEGVDEKSIMNLLQSSRNDEALHTLLQNTPIDRKISQEVKDRTACIMSKIVQSYRLNEIEGAVGSLSESEADLLIKLVYRAFDILPDGALCQSLLQWHSHIITRFGKGAIVRVFASRNSF